MQAVEQFYSRMWFVYLEPMLDCIVYTVKTLFHCHTCTASLPSPYISFQLPSADAHTEPDNENVFFL